MFSLKEKCALVTGASGGIGKEIARVFHEAGATVALSGRRVEALQTAARQMSASGERVHILPASLDKEEDVKNLVPQAEERMGGIHILVNNAGLTKDSLALRMKDEDWDDVISVNLKASFLLIRAALRGMIRRKSGRIIGIASVTGVMGNAGQANYAASKAGMIGMTKSLAREVAPRGITVNCIAPGFIETAMTQALGLKDAQKDALLQTIPLERFGAPQEIAAAALYLASDEAAYMTGQTLHVNGGMAMP